MTTSRPSDNAFIILLNGPMHCGKTKLTNYLKSLYPKLVDRRIKDRIHELVMQIFSVPEDVYFEHYENKNLKDTPTPLYTVTGEAFNKLLDSMMDNDAKLHYVPPSVLHQLTPRQAMIYVSDVICKPTFGKDYFGHERAKAILENEWAIDDSCGFKEELPPTLDRIGQDNTLLIRIHTGEEFNAKDDSRKLIPRGIIDNTFDVTNNKEENTLEDYILRATDIVTQFIYEREYIHAKASEPLKKLTL